jgi:hypothetical protein
MDTLLLGALGLVVLAGDLIFLRGLIRALRTASSRGRDFRARWRSLDPAHRKRLSRSIRRAIRRGEGVPDPADASLALDSLENSERLLEAIRLLYFGLVPTMLFLVALGLVDDDRVLLFAGAGFTAYALLGMISTRRRGHKLRAAAAAIRARGGAR